MSFEDIQDQDVEMLNRNPSRPLLTDFEPDVKCSKIDAATNTELRISSKTKLLK